MSVSTPNDTPCDLETEVADLQDFVDSQIWLASANDPKITLSLKDLYSILRQIDRHITHIVKCLNPVIVVILLALFSTVGHTEVDISKIVFPEVSAEEMRRNVALCLNTNCKRGYMVDSSTVPSQFVGGDLPEVYKLYNQWMLEQKKNNTRVWQDYCAATNACETNDMGRVSDEK